MRQLVLECGDKVFSVLGAKILRTKGPKPVACYRHGYIYNRVARWRWAVDVIVEGEARRAGLGLRAAARPPIRTCKFAPP